MTEKILLTGATGFLGSHILEALLERGFDVVIVKRSLSDVWRIEKYLGEVSSFDVDMVGPDEPFSASGRIDCVIHTAACYGRKNETIPEIIETNVILPVRLLEAGARHGTDTFINTDTFLHRNLNPYSLSKSHFVDWLEVYSERFRVINVGLDHLYGPKDDEKRFVSFVIRKFLDNAESVELTSGEQERDFIYISDLAEAYIRVVEAAEEMPGGLVRFEVGTGSAIPVKDLVLKIKELIGNTVTEPLFGALPHRKNETMKSRADTTAIEALGWRPRIALEEGLKRTIEELRSRKIV